MASTQICSDHETVSVILQSIDIHKELDLWVLRGLINCYMDRRDSFKLKLEEQDGRFVKYRLELFAGNIVELLVALVIRVRNEFLRPSQRKLQVHLSATLAELLHFLYPFFLFERLTKPLKKLQNFDQISCPRFALDIFFSTTEASLLRVALDYSRHAPRSNLFINEDFVRKFTKKLKQILPLCEPNKFCSGVLMASIQGFSKHICKTDQNGLFMSLTADVPQILEKSNNLYMNRGGLNCYVDMEEDISQMESGWAKMSCELCKKLEEKEREFKKCIGCKRVHYCSLECSQKDWKDHKTICKAIQKKNKSQNE